MLKDIKFIIEKLKENEEVILENLITFIPINTYEEVKEYFENNNENNIIIKNLNNLKFKVNIENIDYIIEFKKDEFNNDIILINNKKTNYNLDSFLPAIYDSFQNKDSIFFKKNNNGLSILTMILKNDICKTELLDKIQVYISGSNIKPNKKFIKAICEAGNIDLFKFFINNSIYEYLFNKNILANACFGGNYDIIHILEDKGYEINLNTLKKACASNNVEIVQYLLDNYYKNFDLENIDNFFSLNYGDNKLFFFIKNPEIALIFLNKLEELFKKNQKMILNFFGRINGNKTKKYTKEKEENIMVKEIKNHLYSILFSEIVEGNHLEIAYLMIKETKKNHCKIDINYINNNNNIFSPLHCAIINRNIEIIKLLLSNEKINVNLGEKKILGVTPLFSAVGIENLEIIKLLLSNEKININMETYYNRNYFTPLHFTAENGKNPEVIKLLLSDEKINVNAMDTCERTPLHYAAIKNRNPEIIKLLLSDERININAADYSNYTALHYAIIGKNSKAIELLLSDRRLKIEDNNLMEQIQKMSKQNQEIAKGLEIYQKNKLENATQEIKKESQIFDKNQQKM